MSQRFLVITAFAITYFVWGSTYLANYWAIDSLPPFGMCGVRFLVAGALLYALSFFRGEQAALTQVQWKNAGLMGVMFLVVGVGGVVWAQQWVATSMSAMLVAFQPLLVMVILWLGFGERPPGKAFLGAGIGIIGMALLIGQPQLATGPAELIALGVIGLAITSWAVGMTLNPRLDLGPNNFRSTAAQMLVGGGVCLAFSLMIGEWRGWTPAQLSTKTLLSLAYLIIFGGIIAFSAFNYLMKTVSPAKAATSTYVNPVVAACLGALLNNELVTGQTVMAGAILLTGVYFINSARAQAAET